MPQADLVKAVQELLMSVELSLNNHAEKFEYVGHKISKYTVILKS